MAQMLAMVVNEREDDWDARLPHVEFAYNNSVSAATGLPPNDVHMGTPPHLLLTIFDHSGVAGHQSLARDHLAYCDLASERQQRANDIVREMHAFTVSRVERRNSRPFRTLCARSPTSLWVTGIGCITRPPLIAKARKPARMQSCSRPNSR